MRLRIFVCVLCCLVPFNASAAISGTAVQCGHDTDPGTSVSVDGSGTYDGWSTPTSGNLLVYLLGQNKTGTQSQASFTVPSGFTEVQVYESNNFDVNGSGGWKVSDGTESSITGGINTDLGDVFLTVCEFSSTDLDVSAVEDSGEDESAVASDIQTSYSGAATATSTNGLAIYMHVLRAASLWDAGTSFDNGVMQTETIPNNGTMWSAIATEVFSSTGSKDNTITTTDTGGRSYGVVLLFGEDVDADAPVYTVSPACSVTSDTTNCTATATDASPNITHYMGVYADGSTPSVSEIKSGTGTGFVSSTNDSDSVGSGVEANLTSGANLTASTAYDVWLMAEDSVTNQTSAQKVDITTTAASTTVTLEYCDHVELYYRTGFCPPELSNPVGGANVSSTTSDTTVTSDHTTGTLYWCVSQSATRTSSEIQAGTNCQAYGNTASPLASTNTFNVTGLTAETSYYSHYVHVENQQDSNVSVSSIWSTLPSSGTGLVGAGYFVCDGGSGGNTTEPDGSDSNNGLSMANAWLSLDKVNQTVSALGSDVYLCEGGVWSGESLEVDWNGTSSDRVIIGCYYNNGGTPYLCDSF